MQVDIPFWLTTILCNICVIFHEYIKIKNDPYAAVTKVWNWIILISICLQITVVVLDVQSFEGPELAFLASVSTLFMCLRVLYWSQSYGKIFMYWKIVMDSVIEARHYLTMVFFMIITFTLSIHILDKI
jgi:hypothetical protein